MKTLEQQHPSPPIAYILEHGLPGYPPVQTEPVEPFQKKRKGRYSDCFDFSVIGP